MLWGLSLNKITMTNNELLNLLLRLILHVSISFACQYEKALNLVIYFLVCHLFKFDKLNLLIFVLSIVPLYYALAFFFVSDIFFTSFTNMAFYFSICRVKPWGQLGLHPLRYAACSFYSLSGIY